MSYVYAKLWGLVSVFRRHRVKTFEILSKTAIHDSVMRNF